MADEPCGFAGSFILDPLDERGIIGPVGVLPDFRRQGIGGALMWSVMNILKRYGCRYAYLGTNVDNNRAVSLYKKLGFEEIFHIIQFEKFLTDD